MRGWPAAGWGARTTESGQWSNLAPSLLGHLRSGLHFTQEAC